MQQTTFEPLEPAWPLVGRWSNRLVALGLLLGPGTLLAIASRLTPDGRGMRTHEQLGLPSCAFFAGTGMPCPTCGMTTAFAHAAHGQLLSSFFVQPFGAFLAVLSACLVLLGGYALATDLPLQPIFRPAGRGWPLAFLLTLLLGAWLYKMLVVRFGNW